MSQYPDPDTVQSNALENRMVDWDRVGYSDQIQERLAKIWQTYGIEALEDVEQLMVYYQLWIDTKRAEQMGVFSVREAKPA